MKPVFLFDFDGVIYDSFQKTVSTCKVVFKEFLNIDVTESYVRELFRGSIEEEIRKLVPVKEKRREFRIAIYAGLDMLHMHIYKNMESLLCELEQAGRIIIITSNNTKIVKSCLEKHNLLPHLEVIGGDMKSSKTEKITDVKNRYPDAKHIYIGDTTADIREATAAQVPSVAVTWGYHTKEWLLEERPTYIVDTVEELRTVLLENF